MISLGGATKIETSFSQELVMTVTQFGASLEVTFMCEWDAKEHWSVDKWDGIFACSGQAVTSKMCHCCVIRERSRQHVISPYSNNALLLKTARG